jgi:hypothetical protein
VAVVAVLLSILKMLELEEVGLAVAALWVAVVAVAQGTIGSKWAVLLSQLGGLTLALFLWWMLPINDATVTLLILVGGGGGLIPLVFVEIAGRVVTWINGFCDSASRRD